MVASGLTGLALMAGMSAAGPSADELTSAWSDYVRVSVHKSGRVIDRKGGRVTTSEGQAYGMLRAVWAGDRSTFHRIDTWTQRHLQGQDPTALPAWKWGRKRLRRRVLDPQPATDADILIAWALLLAAEHFEQPDYRVRAKALVQTIWDTDVHRVGDRLVLLPGPWAATSDPLRLNPSYFLPFAMRAFVALDPAHDWTALIDDGYDILTESTAGELAPDWLYLDPTTGARVPAPDPSHELHGFESMRLPWTLAAEVMWFDDPRAKALLVPYLAWQAHFAERGWLPALATADGAPAADYPHLALYGALLPAWGVDVPNTAAELYATKIAPTRGPNGWGDPADYYAQNWIWFGLALWSGLAVPPEMTP